MHNNINTSAASDVALQAFITGQAASLNDEEWLDVVNGSSQPTPERAAQLRVDIRAYLSEHFNALNLSMPIAEAIQLVEETILTKLNNDEPTPTTLGRPG